MDWYYVQNGQQSGPIDDDQLRGLVGDGTITDKTLVWNQTMEQWQPFGGVRETVLPGAEATTAGDSARHPVTCTECGRLFGKDEVIDLGGRRVCAGCKPLVMQKIQEGVADSDLARYAGFWIRFLGKILDGVIVFVVGVVPSMIVQAALQAVLPIHRHEVLIVVPIGASMLLSTVIKASYSTFFHGKYGATPGKMACGLRLVRSDGSAVGYGRACGRHFAELISKILYIGYIIAAFDSEKRALHDHICDTRVVYRS